MTQYEAWNADKTEDVKRIYNAWLKYMDDAGIRPTDLRGVKKLHDVPSPGNNMGAMTRIIGMAYDRHLLETGDRKMAMDRTYKGLCQQSRILMGPTGAYGSQAADRIYAAADAYGVPDADYDYEPKNDPRDGRMPTSKDAPTAPDAEPRGNEGDSEQDGPEEQKDSEEQEDSEEKGDSEERSGPEPEPEPEPEQPRGAKDAPTAHGPEERGTCEERFEGLSPKAKEVVLKAIHHASKGKHVMFVGPAGCGKSYDALLSGELWNKYYAHKAMMPGILTAPQEAHNIEGYCDIHSKRVMTPFTYSFEEGVALNWDEVDRSNELACIAANAALANRMMTFPGEGVARQASPNFICFATANTFGRGADADYNTANQLDASTLDRFAVIYVDYDLDTVRQMSVGRDGRPHEGLVVFFEAWHKAVKACHLSGCVFSYRSVGAIAKALELEDDDVMDTAPWLTLNKQNLKLLKSVRKSLSANALFEQLVKGIPSYALGQLKSRMCNDPRVHELLDLKDETHPDFGTAEELRSLVNQLERCRRMMEDIEG